jgi:hypothetical protein
MRGDDFLDPARSHHRSSDWDGVERIRLRDTVLRPFRSGSGSGGTFRRFDWSTRALGRSHEALWHDVWVPNERVFVDRFAPRSMAQVLVPSGGQPAD